MSIHQDNLIQRKRWQVISLVLGLITILCLIAIIILALPKKMPPPRYIHFSTEENFKFKVLESDDITADQKELIIVNQLKEYIKSRVENLGGQKYNKNEFDLVKFNYIKAFSNAEVFDQYFRELKRIHENAEFYKRDVKILSAIKQEENKYLFNFNILDYYEDESQPVVNRFAVYLKFTYQDVNSLESKLKKLNPLGIKITWYRGDRETNNGKTYDN